MENRASLPDQPMNTAYAMLDLLGVKMNYDDFLDLSYFALNLVKPFCTISRVDVLVSDAGICDLPVDMKFIKAVSSSEYVANSWRTIQTITSEDGVRASDEFGGVKIDTSYPDTIVQGGYVDFNIIDKSTIKVSHLLAGTVVHVLGLAPSLDAEGMPLLTSKQVQAMAYQIAVLYAQRRMFMGCNDLDINYLTAQASKRTAQSRVPDYISDNQWDEVLNVRSSFDRKSFNSDFKFVK